MAQWGEKPRNITLTVRITEEQKRELEELAQKAGVRVSYLGYQIIYDYLKNNDNNILIIFVI